MKTINLNGGYMAMVDDEDYERVCNLPWRAYKDKMNTPKGYCVDHKNGNGLDNTRSNLRIVTVGANLHNAMRPISKSGYRGVEFAKHVGKYRAFINFNHKYKHLGYFTCPIEAAKARDREAIRLYGKDAILNFPQGNN